MSRGRSPYSDLRSQGEGYSDLRSEGRTTVTSEVRGKTAVIPEVRKRIMVTSEVRWRTTVPSEVRWRTVAHSAHLCPYSAKESQEVRAGLKLTHDLRQEIVQNGDYMGLLHSSLAQ